MVQENYTIKREKGKHLTLVEKGKIEAFLKMGISKTKIADLIGVSRRTIQREIQRGWVTGLQNTDLSTYETYSAQKSHNRYLKLQSKKQGYLKIAKNHKLIAFLEYSMLVKKDSPYAALNNAKKNSLEVNISQRTLYNYIHQELFINFSEKDMCYKRKKVSKNIREKRIRKIGGKSIEERAKCINNREEIGHMEMDTVVGSKGSLACLLVLTDRKSRLQVIRKMEAKTMENVVKSVRELILEFPELIKTITSDNGSEFMNAKAIEEMGIEYFYAHSYCSYERGTNENNNKLIRRHIPKGTDISVVSEEKIKEIEEWMNTYPRKLFDGKSAKEVYNEELTKKIY